MLNKRQRRRRAWRERQYQNQMATKTIAKDYLWSSTTWGGTRCSSCGIRTEPRYQSRYRLLLVDGRAHGIVPVCHRTNQCPGENLDWQDQFIR